MTNLFPIEVDTTTVYGCPILEQSRSLRRQFEQMAVGSLICRVFGPDSRLLHKADGAPFIEGFDGYISISHSPDMALLAVDYKGSVGVDIDSPREQLRHIRHKFLNSDEHLLIGDDIDMLLRAWTAKEAVFKAAGIADMTISEVSLSPDFSSATARNRHFKIRFIPVADKIIAIAKPTTL